MVGVEKLKERLLKLVVQEDYIKDSDLLSEDNVMVGIWVGGFWDMVALIVLFVFIYLYLF